MNSINLKLSLRNFIANKMYVLISIFGLSVGFSVCFLIALFAKYELSYDSHFPNADNIYRVNWSTTRNGVQANSAQTTFMLKPAVENLFPEILLATRVNFQPGVITKGSQPISEPDLIFADPSFFDIFEFQFSQGDGEAFSSDIRSIVLTESAVDNYFGTEEPIGKILEYGGISFIVSAVIEDIPENTHFSGQIILPIKGVEHLYDDWMTTNAGGTSHYTYFILQPDTNTNQLTEKISEYMISTYPNNIRAESSYPLQKITDIHLRSNLRAEIKPDGSIFYVYIFVTIAVIIMALACTNYINLSIAASFNRAKEISIKKILGATRNSQVLLFQWEAIMITLVSGILALALALIMKPYLSAFLGKSIPFSLANDIDIILGMLISVVFIGLLSGRMPALFLFRLKTTEVLRGSPIAIGNTKISARNGLIVLQFLIASALFSGSMIVMGQIEFLQNKDLGLDTNNVLMIPIQNSEIRDNYKILREQLLATPGILAVSASSDTVTSPLTGRRPYTIEGNESVTVPTVVVDHDYFEVLGAELVSGRFFSEDIATDETEAFVMNASAVNLFGVKDPIGTGIRGRSFTGSKWSVKDARIIGVVNDFNIESLHSEIPPVVFSLATENTWPVSYIFVRIANGSTKTALNAIENLVTSIAPVPFQYEFIQDSIDQHYGAEQQFFTIFSAFSTLAIVISSLGLYAISAFMMKKKSKNIAIRKILGAESMQIVAVLSKEFMVLVLLASILSWPISYFYSNQWLQSFAYRTDINLWPFVIATVSALVIALMSIFFNAITLAKANPIDSIQT